MSYSFPDEYPARNMAAETGETIIEVDPDQTPASRTEMALVGWTGRCEVHAQFTLQDTLVALRPGRFRIASDGQVCRKAARAVQRMIPGG